MREWVRVLRWVGGRAAAAFLLDEAVWTLRGSPVRQVEVQTVTAMELKGQKEDYFPADTQMVPCQVSLLPFPGSNPPCWWVARHSQILQRY